MFVAIEVIASAATGKALGAYLPRLILRSGVAGGGHVVNG
jgi:hypothetical protein